MEFSEIIKMLRKENNLTQSELGEKLNLSKGNISKYESGVHEPNIETLKMLSDIFDVSIDYLLGKTIVRKPSDTFAAHTDDDMSDEAKMELENFKQYLKIKYGK